MHLMCIEQWGLFDIEFLVFQDNFTDTCKLFKFFKFFRMGYESDNIAFLAHTASTPSTVSVGFNISRDIKVYNTFEAIDINPHEPKVCCKKKGQLVIFKLFLR